MQDFDFFPIMFYYIISTTYKKIGDLFCPVHISGLSHNVHTIKRHYSYQELLVFVVVGNVLRNAVVAAVAGLRGWWVG